ncbi:MAG: MarR family transcriptional regulator [Lachnospiraceae bacterium]|nr:MarR family transcriptional regulator [Lachnospiraceae bacterium]MDD3615947.1 MarR family transcriptional regulator [Lachnospiraceae bacterium]
MDKGYDAIQDILVNLFNEIMNIEEKAIITPEFKDITNNDMHIIDAIGVEDAKNMSSIAKIVGVTVGTLTIAINSLVKKQYATRVRSEDDRRVVLISLTAKGRKAYQHHKKFHEKMVQATVAGLKEDEKEILVHSLQNLSKFFRNYEN